MSRVGTSLPLLLAATLGGCSLIWTPTYPDAAPAPDADVDAFVEPPDGGQDAGVDAWAPDAPDAWAPDAWVRPPEICAVLGASGMRELERFDNDMDGLRDCADPDCYGEELCCTDRRGRPLGGVFGTEPPSGWERHGTSLAVGAGGGIELAFGSGGDVRRTECTPLASGARLDFDLHTTGSAGEFDIVFSPAASPGPEGFLDEVALRFSSTGAFQVTRVGTAITLPDLPPACATLRTDPTTYDLSGVERVIVNLRPGVAAGVSVLLMDVEILGTIGGCSSVRPVDDLAIPIADLVRHSIGLPDNCLENPGLHLAFEGTGRGFEIGPTVDLQRFQCASPASFEIESPAIQRPDLSTTLPASGDFAEGGIGAPDLDFEDSTWRLAFDGSRQDRSSEIFQALDTRIGLSYSTSFGPWRGSPTDDGAPMALAAPNTDDVVREPAVSFEGTNVVVFARARGDGTFDLYRAGSMGGTGGTLTSASALATAPACSYREPAIAPANALNTDFWVFFRCDAARGSTLGALRVDEDGGVTVTGTDLLRTVSPSIAGEVRAVDLVTRAVDGPGSEDRRYFAVWIMVDRPGETVRELHLYAGEAPEGTFPELEPYAGNPVLLTSDLDEGCTGLCEVSSFGVGAEVIAAAPDRLRFLFARSRGDGASTRYELVRRSQIAPSPIDR